jgi:hypothetical protein
VLESVPGFSRNLSKATPPGVQVVPKVADGYSVNVFAA